METSACSAGLPVCFHPALRKLLLWDFDTMSKYPPQPLSASKSSGQKGAGLEMQTFSVAVASPFMDCYLFLSHSVLKDTSWQQSTACHPSGSTSGQPKGRNPLKTQRVLSLTCKCCSIRGHRCVCTELRLTWNTHGEPQSASLVPLPRRCRSPVNHSAPPTHKSAAKTTHQRPLRDQRKAGAGPPDNDLL